MTWQGGKTPRAPAEGSPFAPLHPLLAGHQRDAEAGLRALAQALRNHAPPVKIQIRLLEGDKTEHWDVKAGKATRAARPAAAKTADVLVVMRRETWVEIAQGRLAPFDALFAGRLRAGGDLETAKRVVQHLSSRAVPFVPPC